MNRYHYEIDTDNAVRVWDLENPNEFNVPFLFQPVWPDGTPWSDRSEAEAWVELFIDSMLDEASEFLPGENPAEPKRLRPDPTE
jgi:hypothetical protein